MLKDIFLWIVNNLFGIKTQTTNKEIDDNQNYANIYQKIDAINFNAIFSKKLANFVTSQSEFEFVGDNKRADELNNIGKQVWRKLKKITAMALGTGGCLIVPYSKKGKLYYNIVPQNRLTIDTMDGELITGATILAERRVLSDSSKDTIYLRWTNYKVEDNGNLVITQKYTDENGKLIATPSFWRNIQETMVITNVDRVPFGYIKSSVDNRKATDNYGVPITYGCESTILEIRECLKQIAREYKLKECFVGADITMFDGKNALPTNGLWKKVDSGEDGFWEVFDPAIRESSYYTRLQELYRRLEIEVGTSAGILSDVQTQNATATEVKRATFDTFTIVDDMRSNIEKGLEDFYYACNVLANVYGTTPDGESNIKYSWSNALIEDEQQEFSQMIQGVNLGIISKAELRQWLKPAEDLEESEKAIQEIQEDLIKSMQEEPTEE